MTGNTKLREAYFDNLKGILIYLVTAGHFLMPFLGQRIIDDIFYYIYTFHMPCFIFISGYFAKSVFVNNRFRLEKAVNLFWLYLLYKGLVYITEGLAAGLVWNRFKLLTESGAPWYLLAMVLWYLLLPVVTRLKPRIVLPVALIIGLLSGYWYSLHYFLTLNRVLAFSPFFYAGYFMKKDFHKELREEKKQLLFFVIFVFLSLFVLSGVSTYLYPYKEIVYGISYKYLHVNPENGGVIRLGWYLLASVFLLCLLHITPGKKTFYTKAGACSLQIYILHRPFRDICQLLGVFEEPLTGSGLLLMLVLCGSALLVLALSNSVLNRLFQRISRLPSQLWQTVRKK